MGLEASSFPGDPYGHITNQAGHFCIGLALSAILWPLASMGAALLVGLAYGVLWEWLIQRGRMWRDSFEDTVHVTTGGGLVVSALGYDYPGVVAVLLFWAGLLTLGAWRRS